jgi:hypothetical protein
MRIMKILNEDENTSLDRVTIYLSLDEAKEMRDSLESLISNPIGRHEHIPDKDFNKEITVCIYDLNNISQFNEQSKKLILED